MHPRFAALLEWASQHYDLVLVDTPPLLAVTDAAIVGRLAGTTLLVARFGVTAAKEIEITQRRLEQNGIEVKGDPERDGKTRSRLLRRALRLLPIQLSEL